MVAVQDALPVEPDGGTPSTRIRSPRPRSAKAWLALAPFLALYAVLIVVPTVGLLVKSFSRNDSAELEILNPRLLFNTSFTLDNYKALFTDSYNLRMIATTIIIAVIAVALTVVIGTPIAYQLAVDRTRLSGTANWILSLPIYMPTVVVAYALVLFFGPNGILNTASTGVGLPRWDISYTAVAVVLGTVYVLVPLYVRMLSAAFAKVPEDLVSASMSLGAGELRTLIRVVLPIVRPTILAAVILDFAFAVGMVEIALIVGGGTLNVPYLPVEILHRSTTFEPDIPLTSAMAGVLVVIALVGQAVAGRLNRKAGRNVES